MPGEAGGGTMGVRDSGRGGGARGVVVWVVGARGGRAGMRRLGPKAPLLLSWVVTVSHQESPPP